MERTSSEKSHIHYGWIIVAVEFLLSGMCVGTLINSMGVFVKPVSEGLGIDRSMFTLVLSISSLVSTVCYPFWGSYMKKNSIKRCYLVSAILIPLIFLGYSCSTKLWQFYLLSGVMGTISASVTSLATSSLLNRWFTAKRGLAVSIATAGSGLIPALFIPIVTDLIEKHGWQYGYRWLGAVYGIIVLLCAALFIKDWPKQKGLAPYGETGDVQSTTLGEQTGIDKQSALKSRAFYLLALGAFLCGLVYNGMNNNVLAYLTDIGYSSALSARVVSMGMMVMVVAKLLMGVLFDRYGFTVCFCLGAGGALCAAVALLLARYATPALYLYALAFGFTASFPALCCSYGTLHLFGSKDFSSISGLITSAMYLGLASGSTVISAIYDFSGAYTASWALCAVLAVGAGILLASAVKTSRSVSINQ